MGQRVIYVMTHDSIGLGEDGPTHQPVEHLAALRAIPGLQVMRPADAIETAECWQIALEQQERPSDPRAHAPEPAGAAHQREGKTSAPRAPTVIAGEDKRRRSRSLRPARKSPSRSSARLLKQKGIAAARWFRCPRWSCSRSRTTPTSTGSWAAPAAASPSRPASADRLGALARRQGRLRRHARLRRQRARSRSLQAFRHHAEGRR